MSSPRKRARIEDKAKEGEGVVFSMASGFGASEGRYRLLEATSEVLAALTRGETLFLKGGDGDEAVLCTGAQTHRIQKVETSNTVLLVPPLDDAESSTSCQPSTLTDVGSEAGVANGASVRFRAVGAATYTFVTEPVPPRLDQLASLLARCPYGACAGDRKASGSGSDSAAGGDGVDGGNGGDAAALGRPTLAELCAAVQASTGEIQAALAEMHCVEVRVRVAVILWCFADVHVVAQPLMELFLPRPRQMPAFCAGMALPRRAVRARATGGRAVVQRARGGGRGGLRCDPRLRGEPARSTARSARGDEMRKRADERVKT